MDETVLMTAKGQQDTLELLVDKVRIRDVHYHFDIFLDKISAILLVHASGIVPGSVEFFFPGAGQLQHKYNHIIYTAEQQPEFEKIKDAIENMIKEAR